MFREENLTALTLGLGLMQYRWSATGLLLVIQCPKDALSKAHYRFFGPFVRTVLFHTGYINVVNLAITLLPRLD